MKIRKKFLSSCLAVMLVAALAIPASAQTVIRSYDYYGFGVSVSDTCNLTNFSTVIESHTDEYLLCTNVYVQLTQQQSGSDAMVFEATPSAYIMFNSADVGFPISYIICEHWVGDYEIDEITVYAS